MNMLPKGSSRAPLATTLSAGCLIIYENDGTPILGVILGWKKQRYAVLNDRGKEMELDSARIHELPGKLPGKTETTEEKVRFLVTLRTTAEADSTKVNIEEIWTLFGEDPRELETDEIAKEYFGNNDLNNHLALRFALLKDKFYFKRKKDSFSPRPKETVEELRKAENTKQEKLRVESLTVEFFRARAKNPAIEIPPEALNTIHILEDTVTNTGGNESGHHKESKELVERAASALSIDFNGRLEQKAFQILEKIHYFNSNTNLALVRYRPAVAFSDVLSQEAKQIPTLDSLIKLDDGTREKVIDLTSAVAFTVDDESTKDMDDALSIEELGSGFRFGVHITDVASVILPGTQLDSEARSRATSIYIPEGAINMFPPELSEEKLSLVSGTNRLCISCLIETDRDFIIKDTKIALTLVKIAHRYSYEQIDEVLEKGYGKEHDPALDKIYNFALDHETERLNSGGLKISKRDVNVVLDGKGDFKLIEIDEHSPGRSLIAEMAVIANGAFAEFAVQNKFPLVFRGQESPEEDDSARLSTIPQGAALDYAMRSRLKRSTTDVEPKPHATLGLKAYAQATSPIRRYLDLVNQRQIRNFIINGRPFYNREELIAVINSSDEPLGLANAVSRESKRFWLLKHLQKYARKNSHLSGTVTRTDLKNPMIEIDEIFISLPVKMSKVPPLGTRVQLRIAVVDPHWDYVKLEAEGI